jgi:polyhydroxyalkanoate synthesis repressor PhaR
MTAEPICIKRYPNRRFYASHTSRYVSLTEIEQMIRDGATVEIMDSQTGEDLTHAVLIQIMAERYPDKVTMFPAAMLHSMLRANEAMTEFLQAYFHNAATYLEYLQKHATRGSLGQPMQWMKAWLDSWPIPQRAKGAPKSMDKSPLAGEQQIAERMARLEERIAELEAERRAK